MTVRTRREPLQYVDILTLRNSRLVEPGPVDAGRLDDERLALPMPDRVTIRTALRRLRDIRHVNRAHDILFFEMDEDLVAL